MAKHRRKPNFIKKKPHTGPENSFDFHLLPVDIRITILILVSDVKILSYLMFRSKHLSRAIGTNSLLTKLMCDTFKVSSECEIDFLLTNLESKSSINEFGYVVTGCTPVMREVKPELRNDFPIDDDSESTDSLSSCNDDNSTPPSRLENTTLEARLIQQANKLVTVEFNCGFCNDFVRGKTKPVMISNKVSNYTKMHKRQHDCIALKYFDLLDIKKIECGKDVTWWKADVKITRRNLGLLVRVLRSRNMCLSHSSKVEMLNFLVLHGKMTPLAASILLDMD